MAGSLSRQWLIYDYRPYHKHGRYIITALRKINGRWSVDIVLRTNTMHIIFRRASFAEKQGGHVLTPDFGKIQVAMKMVSSECVFSIKIFTSPSGTTLMFRSYSFDFILRSETIFRVA